MVGKTGLAVGATAVVASFMIGVLLTAFVAPQLVNLFGWVGVDLEAKSVHCRIRIWEGDTLILDEYHAGVVTNKGDNMTISKLFGNVGAGEFNETAWTYNNTYISIGNYSSIDQTATVLPSEWNRTAVTTWDNIAQSQLNMTTTIYPDTNGPYTADCIGINWEDGIGKDNTLWAYDTFTEVTGIDETFTVNVEFQITVSHS